MAADAENRDNASEQERNNGRPVRYGDVVQVISSFLKQKESWFMF